ncbi:GAD-like domain-containing protein [Inquilinus sp. YAF38]|uniref:GAD-like domain-containing protein n=1 Tax=Inquilinus sp. YAF38 TaxID=3233084 RepID=UPI003F93288C
MSLLHKDIIYSIKELGPARQIRAATSNELQRARKILPSPLVDMFEEIGFCSFADGLFYTCHPDEMRSIISLVFGIDPNFSYNDCHVIGYSAFGDFYIWSDKYYNFNIDLAEGFVFCRALTVRDWKPIATPEHMAAGFFPDIEMIDFVDQYGVPLYRRCQEKYGRLEPGECYGFFPALAISGIFGPHRTIEYIRRVKAMEHFAILAQLDAFQLARIGVDGAEPVRPIG